MKIGILGKGVVGGACGEGLALLGHEMFYHDPKLGTTVKDVLNTDLAFICVPTPNLPDQRCDTSLVERSIELLQEHNYQGVIAIKSTISPGTTQRFIDQYPAFDICYVPEFLREHCAYADFVKNHRVLAVGCHSDRAWDLVIQSHGWIPDQSVRMLPTEAEILKYFSNTFNALRVVFANIMYDVCEKYQSNYDLVLQTYLLRQVASPDYMNCSPDLRGYNGLCLPKDVRVMINICKDLDLPFELFQSIDHDNKCVDATVFPGMRQEKDQDL